MDLTLSPAEEAFRDELRAWLDDNNPGGSPPGDEAAFEFRRDWQRKLHEAGWAGVSWPQGVRRPGRDAGRAGDLQRGDRARADARRWPTCWRWPWAGPTVIAHGTEEQKERFLPPILSAEEIWCQGFSEPGVGLRPRVAEDPGGARRRRLGGDRPEGVDDVRPPRQVVHARRPHRPRGAQAQGPDVLPDGHGAGRRAGPAAAPDHRRVRVQRAVHRGGADPATRTSSAARATAGRWRSPRSCTSAPRWPSGFRSSVQIALRELIETRARGAGLERRARQRGPGDPPAPGPAL